MKILMFTNTYSPHVGGVARSVQSFVAEFRRVGHRVIVVAPEFENMPADERDVVRVPALRHFNGTDFSVQLPVPGILGSSLHNFIPDIVHSHHPFLLGSTALRFAHVHRLPLVFTHHTMYEDYTHYVPGHFEALKKFAVELSAGYANLATQVFAPSESVADCLETRGVITPIAVIPTGIDIEQLSHPDEDFRRRMKIPPGSFVVGHLGRLAREKNLGFLIRSVVSAMGREKSMRFLLIGRGPFEANIRSFFVRRRLWDRVHWAGILEGGQVAAAYRAMDVFAFSSKSETQGLVLAEAMGAGVPVVALNAAGVREVVVDSVNGRLLDEENPDVFANALLWVATQSPDRREELRKKARATAERFSVESCARKALAVYELLAAGGVEPNVGEHFWGKAQLWMEAEWGLVSNLTQAAGAALEKQVSPSLR